MEMDCVGGDEDRLGGDGMRMKSCSHATM